MIFRSLLSQKPPGAVSPALCGLRYR